MCANSRVRYRQRFPRQSIADLPARQLHRTAEQVTVLVCWEQGEIDCTRPVESAMPLHVLMVSTFSIRPLRRETMGRGGRAQREWHKNTWLLWIVSSGQAVARGMGGRSGQRQTPNSGRTRVLASGRHRHLGGRRSAGRPSFELQRISIKDPVGRCGNLPCAARTLLAQGLDIGRKETDKT